jgi:biopolymer transport protein ExbB
VLLQSNLIGPGSLWEQGDAVTKLVALLLLAMSLASWYVIVTKAYRLWRLNQAARQVQHGFWTANSVAQGTRALGEVGQGNPFADLAHAGQEAAAHHHTQQNQLQGQLSMSDWMTLSLRQAIDEGMARLQAGMAVLASVGSTAPFVGLFGTVWGIYHALMAIGESGQASLDKVAGPVGESLIMTALGLAVAIPATFGYNALVRGNKSVSAQLNKFGFDLHALFVTGRRTRGTSASSSTSAATAQGTDTQLAGGQ